jgi:DNA mismatch endonuclease (patch repair protein)
MGLRFRKNVSSLPGKPDIVFRSHRVVVFCDGDFWHGRNWQALKKSLSAGANSGYWQAKIESNRKRDKQNNVRLKKTGWHVIRLWETDINRDPLSAAKLVKRTLRFVAGKSVNAKSKSRTTKRTK